jgi:penicillin-binding protein 1A
MAKKINFNDFWQMFKVVQIALWSFVLFVILFFFGVNAGLLGEMPDLYEIQNPNNDVSTSVISSDGEILGSYYSENRIEIGYADLSPYLVKALVATEDKRFYDHSGIDMKGLFGAVFVPIFTGHDRGGASTITQQLAKNLFHQGFHKAGRVQRAKQKLKEWVLAAKIERMFSKDEILTLYLNTVEFGNQSYGIKTAAFTYFGKSPKDIKANEAALLIGLVNSPSRLNPKKHPEKAEERRNIVLKRMLEADVISKAECDSFTKKKVRLNFHSPDYREGLATYLRENLRQELKAWCEKNTKPDGTKYDIYRDGLNVYTTIDSRMQRYAEEAIREHLMYLQDVYFREWHGKDPWKFGERAKPELFEKSLVQCQHYQDLKAQGKTDAEIRKILSVKTEMTIFSYNGDNGTLNKDTMMSPIDSLRYYMQIIQCGFLAINARTGEIKAWVGGPDLKYFQLDHVKKSTKRQVGSTMKPLQYAVAIERGYDPCQPIAYVKPSCGNDNWDPAGNQVWRDGKMQPMWNDGDMVPMQEGLWHSDNRMTANVMCDFGPQALIDMARKLRIESPLDAVPSLCLGVSDISLTEMVGAYSIFANLGVYSKPFYIKKITDKKGNVLATFNEQHAEALDPKVAYTTTEMMKGVINKGTAASLRGHYGLQNLTIAGKTGTTQSNSDAWFMSITPDLVTGCWVGFEQPSVHFATTTTGQGAAAAMPIVGKFLNRSYNDYNLKLNSTASFLVPNDVDLNINFDCSVILSTTDSSISKDKQPKDPEP